MIKKTDLMNFSFIRISKINNKVHKCLIHCKYHLSSITKYEYGKEIILRLKKMKIKIKNGISANSRLN